MRLYTAGGSKANREACRELGVGLMMCDGYRDPSAYPFFAVDNGAFSAWKQGKRWNPATFLHILTRCAEEGRAPEFAVLPDIVGGGEESLRLSMAWHTALDASFPGTRWALAVQDGMDGDTVRRVCGTWGWLTGSITTIFVGGTMEWKLATMEHWARFAHERGMECHVGRIGTVERMMVAERSGADSIDSTTWVQRNGSLRRHVTEYRARTILEDFARRGHGNGPPLHDDLKPILGHVRGTKRDYRPSTADRKETKR